MRGNQTQSRSGTPPSARTQDVSGDRNSTHSIDEQSTASDDSPAIAFDELFALLGDEYVVDILQALSSDEMPARAIADECDMSRPTVYRRLERLTEAGVVTSRRACARSRTDTTDNSSGSSSKESRYNSAKTASTVAFASVSPRVTDPPVAPHYLSSLTFRPSTARIRPSVRLRWFS
jgi:DNA-binding transcriptional ArsR family regulator